MHFIMRTLSVVAVFAWTQAAVAVPSFGWEQDAALLRRDLSAQLSGPELGLGGRRLFRRVKTRSGDTSTTPPPQTGSTPAAPSVPRPPSPNTIGQQGGGNPGSIAQQPKGELDPNTGARQIPLPADTGHGQHAMYSEATGMGQPGLPHDVRQPGDSGRSDAMKSDAGKAATASKPGDEAAAGEKLDRDEKNAMSHQVPRPEDTTQSVFNLPHSEGTEEGHKSSSAVAGARSDKNDPNAPGTGTTRVTVPGMSTPQKQEAPNLVPSNESPAPGFKKPTKRDLQAALRRRALKQLVRRELEAIVSARMVEAF